MYFNYIVFLWRETLAVYSSISCANFSSNLLCIKSIKSPNKIAETIKTVLMIPLTEKEILINMVEIINPEFRITLWNSSVWKNEKSNKITSATIKMLKNCSKKILFMFLKEIWFVSFAWKIPILQFKNEYPYPKWT